MLIVYTFFFLRVIKALGFS